MTSLTHFLYACRFHLSQEHSELINVHDWYQSFSSICCPINLSAKKKGGKQGKPEPSMDPATLQYPLSTRYDFDIFEWDLLMQIWECEHRCKELVSRLTNCSVNQQFVFCARTTLWNLTQFTELDLQGQQQSSRLLVCFACRRRAAQILHRGLVSGDGITNNNLKSL